MRDPGVLLIGIGVLVLCAGIAGSLRRLNVTLDEVDRQIAALSAPVAETLSHVGGIADTADATVARLSGVVGSIESVAANVVEGVEISTNRAVADFIVSVGATLTGVTAGLRRLIVGRRPDDPAENP